MRRARATLRLIALFGVTAGYYASLLVGLPFVAAFPRARRAWRRWNFGGWSRMLARVIGMRIRIRNAPPVAPFLLVSNHLSYIDILAFESHVDSVFIAKSEIAGWPIIGLLCRTIGTIFINRGHRRELVAVLDRAERALDQGLGIVLFAEGTSSSGRSVGAFRSSLLELAVRRRIPVHYAAITYTTPPGETPAEQSICWWADMTFPRHVFQLLQLRRFEASIVFGTEPIQADDRKTLAAELWAAVSAEFTPVTAASGAGITTQ